MEYPIGRVSQFCIDTDKKNAEVYKSRGQSKPLRRLKQNFSGKLAELFVNQHLGAGQEDHILKDYGMGVFHSDLEFAGRGFSIKSQDPDSVALWGQGRFVFGTNDPLASDVYCGVLVAYTFKPFSCAIGFDNYDEFESWTASIESITCKYSFMCGKSVLDLDVWEKADKRLKDKRVLVASKIPFEKRIDLRPSFPSVN